MDLGWKPGNGGRGKTARGRHWRIAAAGIAAIALAAAGCGSSGSSGGNSKTITELDYFMPVSASTGGNVALNWYNAQFEKAHPGVTIKRTHVPYAQLMPKVLQEASAGDLPNIIIIDNPDVPEVAATGQLRTLDGLSGFTTKGYYPGAVQECTYKGKHYCYAIGTNTVGLFYNKQMLAAAHLQPPTTWAQLQSDAKALTTPQHKGIAFDATGDEQSTWQMEPYGWSAGGSLTNVSSPAWTSALQLWTNMVKDGSASKNVLNWGQDPDVTQQFVQKKAAMIEDGPWIFPELNAAGMKYNTDYGIVPIPTQSAGQTPILPLGGETLDLGNTGSSEQQSLAWDWVKGMQQPATMKYFTSLNFYLPTIPSITQQELTQGPQYTVFAKEAQSARARTIEYGANYPKVSQAMWTAIQSAISGTAAPGAALKQAQTTVANVPKVNGG
jgi:multiple sugar transport system substrate-binding protein